MANRLLLWRTANDLSQTEAGAKLDLSRGTYSPLESGRMKPTSDIAERLKSFFGEDSHDLLRPIADRTKVSIPCEIVSQ